MSNPTEKSAREEGCSAPRLEQLVARTADGLHDAALSSLRPFLKQGSRVLDLGAGTGAWAARLTALGHAVTCVERDVDRFVLDSVACIDADLNADFAAAVEGTFDVITAIEVIEHLENPRHFLRQARTLLKDDGIFLITTPNIECVPGRLRFLRSGQFRMFDRDPMLNDSTHITPIQTFMFEKMLIDTGYDLLLRETTTSTLRINNPVAKIVSRVVQPLVSGSKGGDHHIFFLRKAG
jgi:2-polyprenyl-3-methyl-5-hydroxy-6-metoxy-1,4-benzoquinol methylase